MGGSSLKNVFIDVSGNCSVFDREAFGRNMLILIKLWEKATLVQDKIFDELEGET